MKQFVRLMTAILILAIILPAQAAARENWLNYSEAQAIEQIPVGCDETAAGIRSNALTPLSITTEDFSGDGIPDLVSGFGDGATGYVTIQTANEKAIFPKETSRILQQFQGIYQEPAFLPMALTLKIPGNPDFLIAGDFDNDGRRDVIAATRNHSSLYFLKGDGAGSLLFEKSMDLPGEIDFLLSADVNRPDGLMDFVVALTDRNRALLMIFESPEGALSAEPETHELPESAAEVIAGLLDDDPWTDIAAACGTKTVIFRGRNRRLTHNREMRQAVSPSKQMSIDFPATIASMAMGDFIGDRKNELAVLLSSGEFMLLDGKSNQKTIHASIKSETLTSLPAGPSRIMRAKCAALPGDELVVWNPGFKNLGVLSFADSRDIQDKADDNNVEVAAFCSTLRTSAPPVAVTPMRLNLDAIEDILILSGANEGSSESALSVRYSLASSNFVVDSPGSESDYDYNDGLCRACLAYDAESNCIEWGCTLTAALQQINASSITANITFSDTLLSVTLNNPPEVNNGSATIVGPELRIAITGTHTTRGLTLNSGFNVLRNLALQTSSATRLGGGNNIVEGVYAGTSITGLSLKGNGQIRLSGSFNRIGGANENQRNILSNGLIITTAGSDFNKIQGNYFGVNSAGNESFGAAGHLSINASSNCTVGGTAAGEGNLFAGTATAIEISGEYMGIMSVGNTIQGNYFGTDKEGKQVIEGASRLLAIRLDNTSDTLVGGTAGITVGGPLTGAGNLIAARNGGIWAFGDTSGDLTIQGNYIGTDITGKVTDPDGTADSGDEFGCTHHAIIIRSLENTLIGGITANARNLISGNQQECIYLEGAGSVPTFIVSILGNYIGTDITGMKILGNKRGAVRNEGVPSPSTVIIGGAEGATPGGPLTGAGNLLSGNLYGIYLEGVIGKNVIQGNYIGTDATGEDWLPNNGNAVSIVADQIDGEVLVGGNTPAARNIIAGNKGWGLTFGGKKAVAHGNYIGLSASGTKILGNYYGGIRAMKDVEIGGDRPGEGNVICGTDNPGGKDDEGVGIRVSGDNVIIKGNKIGTNPEGTIPMPNDNHGIIVYGNNCLIGGPAPEEGNLISGNGGHGIYQWANDGLIQSNLIGTDITGELSDLDEEPDNGNEFGNYLDGIHIVDNASYISIGGIADQPGIGPGNLISGNKNNGINHNFSYSSTRPETNNIILGNLIGTNITGERELHNHKNGIRIARAAKNRIGGANDLINGNYFRNIISGNKEYGIFFDDVYPGTCYENTTQGNFIGTDINGENAIPNEMGGICISGAASRNLIGGFSPDEENVISGNYESGIFIQHEKTRGNQIKGNIIGLDVTGQKELGNNQGITISAAQENIIGGADKEVRNIISGNGFGILLKDAASSNTIQGNIIGLDIEEQIPVPNYAAGITVESGANKNLIGGKKENSGNVISGNGTEGIEITSNANANRIYGNLIGVDSRNRALPNKGNGIRIEGAPRNYIGGGNPSAPDEGRGNIISGNSGNGVHFIGLASKGNVLHSNTIGLDSGALNAVPNEKSGVDLDGALETVIGGTGKGEGNFISANREYGVYIHNAARLNTIQGNIIGLWDMSITPFNDPRGNEKDGVLISDSDSNTIGPGNIISQNAGCGVLIENTESSQNAINGNIIGLDPKGEKPMGNTEDGVRIDFHANRNYVGGTTETDRNVISANGGDGVKIDGIEATNNTIRNNFIGTGASGLFIMPVDGIFPDDSLGNRGHGINIIESEFNTIGGTGAFDRNIVSGNHRCGIYITGIYTKLTRIQNNLIGTDKDGAKALPNESHGVQISGAPATQIGGDTISYRNVISGNKGSGIHISGEEATPSSIRGNIIGTDSDGFYEIPNGQDGIVVDGVANTSIGGMQSGSGNLISGNIGYGIRINGEKATPGLILNNRIGTNSTGDMAIPNMGSGVLIENTPGIIIGNKDAGNLISGNKGAGIRIAGVTATGNIISANRIGVNTGETGALPNEGDGILIENAASNIIGGKDSANVISGNKGSGIKISGETSAQNTIQANVIGADMAAKKIIGNESNGILISGAPKNLIGGDEKPLGNVITGSGMNGVQIEGNQARGNAVMMNIIGVHDQVSTMTNALHGILIAESAWENVIGGDEKTSNTICFNGGNGIAVCSGSRNPLFINSIFKNNGLGIDLGCDGVTENDALDEDSGANNLQNYPLLITAIYEAGNLEISGTLHSKPESQYLVHFYANNEMNASGHGEGYILAGKDTLTTDADGNADFNLLLETKGVFGGMFLSTTATDMATSDTSEFSGCVMILDPSNLPPKELAIQILLSRKANPTEEELKKADVNGDGIIDVADIVAAILGMKRR